MRSNICLVLMDQLFLGRAKQLIVFHAEMLHCVDEKSTAATCPARHSYSLHLVGVRRVTIICTYNRRWTRELRSMQKVNHPNYLERNAAYNGRVAAYVDEVFQTERPGPLGYVSPKRYHPRTPKDIADGKAEIISADVSPSDPTTPRRFAIDDLGDYEHILFSALAWATSNTFVLGGEMGSGKTATVTFIRDVLTRSRLAPCMATCADCKPVIVFLSLDAGTRYTSPTSDVVAAVRDELIDALHKELRRLLITDSLTDPFVNFTVISTDQKFHRFARFLTQRTVTQLRQGQAWTTLDDTQKTDLLLDYVRNSGSAEAQLDSLMAIASYIKSTVRQDHACFVILLDNIDRHFEPSKQLSILRLIFGLQSTGIRVLLSMRPTTFEGLESNAAFSFSYIQHAGPEPLTIGLKRIQHFLAQETWLADSRLTVFERTCLRDRLGAIAALLEVRSIHRSRLAALSGASIRSGLTLLGRLAVNNTIPFDATEPPHKQDWLRAILLGDTEDQHVATDDRYVTNIFADQRQASFRWAPLRLLQLTTALYMVRSARNATTLCTLLHAMLGEDGEDEILAAVNHLLKDTRPLLWVDGAYSYSTYGELLARNDVFHATQAGRAYIRKLILDSVYLQECLFAVAWPGRAAPRDVDCRTSVGRSRGTRALCDILVVEDCEQHQRLLTFTSRSSHLPAFRFQPISPPIVATLAEASVESMRVGIRDSVTASDTAAECQAWREVLQKASDRISLLKLTVPGNLMRARAHVEETFKSAEQMLRSGVR